MIIAVSLYLFLLHLQFNSFDCWIMSDAVLPFPVLLTTIVAVVVSFMLILENQSTEQQHKQEKHFMVMVQATTAGTKRTNEEADIDDTGSGRMKQRMVQYDYDCARRCIQQDYLGLSPIFNHCKFR